MGTDAGRKVGDGLVGGEDSRTGGGWWRGRSHISVHINREEQLGSETDCTTQGSSAGN